MQFVHTIFLILLTCTFSCMGFVAHAEIPAKVDVVIIGAGLSGLSTAYQLKKAGKTFHILEITPRIGGRVRTVRYKIDGSEISADSGMEEYWDSNPAVKILNELKLPVQKDVAISSIVLNKKLYPLGDEDRAGFLKKVFSEKNYKAFQVFDEKTLKPLLDQIHHEKISKELLKLKDVSFADWVKQQKLPQIISEWIRVSIECEIGTQWSSISALDGIAEMHIFTGDGELSHRVVGGNESFTSALSEKIGSDHISVNQKVNRVVSEGDHAKVYTLDMQTNQVHHIEAKHVVSTIPLYRLFEVQFEPKLSDKKRQAIQTMSWGAYFKAHVIVEPDADKFWIKDGVSTLPILSDSELGVIYDGNPSQAGKPRILSLLVTGPYAEAFNFATLDDVRAKITAGLNKYYPGIDKKIKGIEFYRYHPRAIAAWPVGRSRYDDLSNEVRRPENHVYFAGDFTESSHSDGAFISAARVVKQILGSEKKVDKK